MSNLSSVERLDGGIIIVEEEHVNEGNEETGSIPGVQSIIRDPLNEDQNDQVAKQAGHEDNLWDEPQVDVERLLEIPAGNPQTFVHYGSTRKKITQELKEVKILQVVEKTQSDAEQHVDDSQDNGHLHLEGVQERQLVDGNTPYLRNVTINIYYLCTLNILKNTVSANTWLENKQQIKKIMLTLNLKINKKVRRNLFTGSMPMGYGPLNTPTTAGSNCSAALPARVASLEDMRTYICCFFIFYY